MTEEPELCVVDELRWIQLEIGKVNYSIGDIELSIKDIESALKKPNSLTSNETDQFQAEKTALRLEKLEMIKSKNFLLEKSVWREKSHALKSQAAPSSAQDRNAIAITSDPLGASNFSASSLSAAKDYRLSVGTLFSTPFFDPTLTNEDSRHTKLFEYFLTSSGHNATELELHLRESVMMRFDLGYLHETVHKIASTFTTEFEGNRDKFTVQNYHLKHWCEFVPYVKMSGDEKARFQLTVLKCPKGLATGASICDGWFESPLTDDTTCRMRGIIEAKNTNTSPLDALGQACAGSTNVALSQLNDGVPWDEIIVPIVSTNGHLVQFGATVLLQPAFPVFVVISHVLDLLNEDHVKHASTILMNIIAHTEKRLTSKAQQPLSPRSQFSLSTSDYWLKSNTKFFLIDSCLDKSLFNLFDAMRIVHKCSDARQYVLFPICVKSDYNNAHLIFPFLKEYQIGIPDTREQRESYLLELAAAIKAIHAVGIVHLDLYPSNIMWKVNESDPNSVTLKIIDWDAVHIVARGPLSPNVYKRLSASWRSGLYNRLICSENLLTDAQRILAWDISLFNIIAANIDNELLRTNDKTELDGGFTQLCLESLKQVSVAVALATSSATSGIGIEVAAMDFSSSITSRSKRSVMETSTDDANSTKKNKGDANNPN